MIEGSDQAFSQVIKSSSHATFGQQNISYTFDWTQKRESFPATNKTLIPFHNFRCSTGVPNSRNGLEYRIISMIPGIILDQCPFLHWLQNYAMCLLVDGQTSATNVGPFHALRDVLEGRAQVSALKCYQMWSREKSRGGMSRWRA